MLDKTKIVQIWDLEGEFICGGEMFQDTFIKLVKEYGGEVHDAKALWNLATPHSLSDYLGNLKVRVREIKKEF